jgi:hypothetical protein
MYMSLIRKNLYLGDFRDSRNTAFLIGRGIGLVINATEEWPPFAGTLKICEIKYSVRDDLQPGSIRVMREFIPHAVAQIETSLRSGVPVLVHCHAGMQRSACIVAAYLMKSEGLTAAGAVTAVRARRSVAFLPGVNFWEALLWWETALKSSYPQV